MGQPSDTADLRARLRHAVESVRLASSAYRPAVAEYLYRRGLAPLYDRLAEQGEPPRALVEGVWRLMLETVATRRFGVSSDHWRGGGYPDRYFPLVWLELLPRWLPAVSPVERTAAVAALFNLGERLPRAAANPVAEALVERGPAFAADPAGTVQAALVDLGLIGRAAAVGWRRLVEQAIFDCVQVDPEFLPGAVVAASERRFVVTDALRPTALHLAIGPDGLGVQATGAAPPDVRAARSVQFPRVSLRLERRALAWSGPAGAFTQPVDGVAPAAIAANEQGDVLWIDTASTRIRWLRAEG